MSTLPPTLAERLAAVDARIDDAVRAAGRDPGTVTRIAVTKGHPAALIRELADLGVRDVAESRHQEAEPKARALDGLGLTWHFVGQLQTNKARAVARYSSVVHSVDRLPLAAALAGDRAAPIEFFIQIDLTGAAGRGGVQPGELTALAEAVLDMPGLRLRGVMAVAPLGADPRPAFARLRGLSEHLRTLAPEAVAISAGMSSDFEAAIAEGATHLRIGTAITGKRPVDP